MASGRAVDLPGPGHALFAFGLLRLISRSSPEAIHAARFLFLGSTHPFARIAVRTRGWFFSRPWPSGPVLAAIAAAFIVTVALVNVPEARSLLQFGTLSLPEQLGIEACSVAYLLVVDALQRSFGRFQPAVHGVRPRKHD